jgi:hypothetical protein
LPSFLKTLSATLIHESYSCRKGKIITKWIFFSSTIFLSQASQKIPSRAGNNVSIGADSAPELLPLPPAGGPPQLRHPAPAATQVFVIVLFIPYFLAWVY